MLRTFNMGIGMILVVSPDNSEVVKDSFATRNESCYEIGVIEAGDGTVRYA
jgi:phosphoribosylformylglycinamidine cyclo-ligase